MPATKLTEFRQSIHIEGGGPARHGICYYICDYVESHQDSPWYRPKDFAAAKAGVTRMRTVPLVNAGKAANVQHLPQAGNYSDGAIQKNSVYRVEVAVGQGASINHETMMLSGDDEFILFDPNWGFYHVDKTASKANFETELRALYGGGPVASFGYQRERKAFYV